MLGQRIIFVFTATTCIVIGRSPLCYGTTGESNCTIGSNLNCSEGAQDQPNASRTTSPSHCCFGFTNASNVEPGNGTVECCKDMLTSWLCIDVIAILHDIIQRTKWSNAVFVHDCGRGPLPRAVLSTLSDLQVGVVQVTSGGSGRQEEGTNLTQSYVPFLTSKVLPETIRRVILCISPDLVIPVMQEAKDFRMLSESYQWFILCPVRRESIRDLTQLFGKESNVLILSSTQDGLPFDSVQQTTPGLSSEYRNAFQLAKTIGLWTWTSHPEEKLTPLSTWRRENGWTLPLPDLLYPNVFRDFGGRLLIIGTIPANPFVNRKIVGNQTTYDGFCIDLLKTMARQLNFRFQIVESPDNKYGALEKDGRWNGMVGMVARKEVDMGVGPYTITSLRETVVDFSVPFMEDGGGILTQKDNSGTSIMAVLETFSTTVWMCILATTLGVCLAFYVVVRFSPYSAAFDEDGRLNKHWRLLDCVMHIYGSFMMRGVEHAPKSLSARCVLGFWWIFGILIVSIYTASLASVLTVDLQGTTIDSLEDLAQSQVKPLVLAGSVWDTLFQTAVGEQYKAIATNMRDMPEVTSDEEALRYVMSQESAFLHDVNNLKFMYAVNCEKLHLAAEVFNSNGLGLILPEKAPYKDAVNQLLLRMQEGGFLSQWRKVWWPVTTQCETQASLSEGKRLGLPKLAGVFLVYGAVLAVSVVCFLVNLCLKKTSVVGKMKDAFRKKL